MSPARTSLLAAALAAACAQGPPPPAALDTAHESCRHCRMAVSERRFAAQIVAPGEEPLFFDDLGCLRGYLAGGGATGEGALAYVAVDASGAWRRADEAVYSLAEAVATPMDSHLLAHASAAARDADPAARGARALAVAEVFGAAGPPLGIHR
jgi:copper chaperone NosL